MKKFFQSKGFIVSALAVLCVAILGICWFVSRDRTEEFRPDESPPSSTSSDWSDGGVQSGDGGGGADAYAPGQSSSAEEEYPKVTSESEGEVEIDFTDTEKPEETPPPVTLVFPPGPATPPGRRTIPTSSIHWASALSGLTRPRPRARSRPLMWSTGWIPMSLPLSPCGRIPT